jgi:hypothetical protein
VLTKTIRYKRTGQKRSTVHSYRRKIRSSLVSLTRTVVLCTTPESVDAATALAELVSREGMNNRNYLLFLTMLETNNPSVVDALVGPRNPFLLFSPIKPNWFLLRETFRILAKFKGNELSVKVLLALLGIVQNAYKASKDGYKIYPLRMSDIYNIGKHLDKERDQLDPRNRLLLEILFDIYFVGIDSEERATKQIGIKANDIRMAFFDNTKRMIDAIPDVLLVKDIVRDPVATKWYTWRPPVQASAALEAREEPEVKVSLQRAQKATAVSRGSKAKAPRRPARKATRKAPAKKKVTRPARTQAKRRRR